jgi:hypothetical protein
MGLLLMCLYFALLHAEEEELRRKKLEIDL